MLELVIGTKFYCDNVLIEVVEYDSKNHRYECPQCIFKEEEYCYDFECYCNNRKDKKDVYFKKIEE